MQRILVTGSHRSGSTWVGRILASTPKALYINEPFNPARGHEDPALAPVFTDRWFLNIEDASESERHAIEQIASLDYRFLRGFRSANNIRSRGAAVKLWIRWRKKAGSIQQVIYKDPIALFSAPWLAENLQMQPVVLIRHPAAFAASLIRLNWSFPFIDFLAQPRLMERLHLYADEIEEAASQEAPILEQASLLWNCFHNQIAAYQKREKNWLFWRHEDLSSNPDESFRTLFNQLKIPYKGSPEDAVRRSSSANKKVSDRSSPFCTIMDSTVAMTKWKQELNGDSIKQIRSLTEREACQFYSPEDW